MQRLLVTGGAGFIGSNFVHYMLERYNYDIVVYDSLTYAGRRENLAAAEQNSKFHFVHGNICDLNQVKQTLQQHNIDTIVNFAAETHVDRSIMQPDAVIKANINGTWALLEVARELGLPRFHQISTDEVYGQGGFVNKFLGDGALGVFEIKAGEDPSLVIEKAISAALKIQERAVQVLGSTLRVSAGLHLGEVAFATVGKAPKLEFTVLGDAVNVSSRLCNLSKEHDNILVISEALKNTSPPSLSAEVLGEFKIKGIEEKMNLFGVPLLSQTKKINRSLASSSVLLIF
jgi:class 3 adenylate cyclase